MNCKLILSPNEIHKLFPIPNSFQDLNQIIQKKLKPHSSAFKLKYKDGEDELITLNSQEDLHTAILSCNADNLKSLKIYVFKRDLESSSKIQSKIENVQQRDMKGTGPKQGLWTKLAISPNKIANSVCGYPKRSTGDNKEAFQRCYTYPSGSPVSAGRYDMFKIEEEPVFYLDEEDRLNMEEKACTCSVCGKAADKAKYICLVCKNQIYCEECEGVSEHPHPLLKLRQHIGTNDNKISHEKETSDSSGRSQENSLAITERRRKTSESTACGKKINYKVQIVSRDQNKPVKIECGEVFDYGFTIKNNGTDQWPADIKLICVNGPYRDQVEHIPSLSPGERYNVKLSLAASRESGKQLSQWRLHYTEDGNLKGFGISMFVETENILKKIDIKQEESKNSPVTATNEEGPLFCPIEMENLRQIYKLAETLNEMFPGDIQTKVRFVESCPRDFDIYNLVDEYLLKLRAKQI